MMIYKANNLTGFGYFGQTQPATLPVPEDRVYKGYKYRALNDSAVDVLITVLSITPAQLSAVQTSGLRYIAHDDAGKVTAEIPLPSDTFLITAEIGLGGVPFLEWFSKLRSDAKTGVVGMPGKYSTPYGAATFRKVSSVDPPHEEADQIFVLTRDIKLVSDITSFVNRSAVVVEPKDGWLTPEDIALRAGLVVAGAVVLAGGVYFLVKRKGSR